MKKGCGTDSPLEEGFFSVAFVTNASGKATQKKTALGVVTIAPTEAEKKIQRNPEEEAWRLAQEPMAPPIGE